LPYTGTDAREMVVIGTGAVVLGRVIYAMRRFMFGDRDDDEDGTGIIPT
jgi:hypothetical protein